MRNKTNPRKAASLLVTESSRSTLRALSLAPLDFSAIIKLVMMQIIVIMTKKTNQGKEACLLVTESSRTKLRASMLALQNVSYRRLYNDDGDDNHEDENLY